jgi:hypothetical protein
MQATATLLVKLDLSLDMSLRTRGECISATFTSALAQFDSPCDCDNRHLPHWQTDLKRPTPLHSVLPRDPSELVGHDNCINLHLANSILLGAIRSQLLSVASMYCERPHQKKSSPNTSLQDHHDESNMLSFLIPLP